MNFALSFFLKKWKERLDKGENMWAAKSLAYHDTKQKYGTSDAMWAESFYNNEIKKSKREYGYNQKDIDDFKKRKIKSNPKKRGKVMKEFYTKVYKDIDDFVAKHKLQGRVRTAYQMDTEQLNIGKKHLSTFARLDKESAKKFDVKMFRIKPTTKRNDGSGKLFPFGLGMIIIDKDLKNNPKKRGKVMKRKKNPSSRDYDDWAMISEVMLMADNDGQHYNQQKYPILKNLARKMYKGTYKPEQAAKLWQYYVDEAVRRYSVSRDGLNKSKATLTIVSPHDRRLMAKQIEEEERDDLDNYYDDIGVKKNPSKLKKGKTMAAKKKTGKKKATTKKKTTTKKKVVAKKVLSKTKAKKTVAKKKAAKKTAPKSKPKKRTSIGKKMIPAQRGSIIGALQGITSDKKYKRILFFGGDGNKPNTGWKTAPKDATQYPDQKTAKSMAEKLTKLLPAGQQLFVINKNASAESIKMNLMRQGFVTGKK